MARLLVSLLCIVAGYLAISAQSNGEPLKQIRALLRQEIGREMPGWSCRGIAENEGGGRVMIESCESGDIWVKIAVVEMASAEEAQAAFKEGKRHFRIEEEAAAKNRHVELHLIKEELTTLGDEGYVLNDRGSEAVEFRKGKFGVSISVVRPVPNQDMFFSRKFAEYANKVLKVHQQ